MYIPLDPVDFKEKTHTYKGSKPTEEEKKRGMRDDKKDLPVYLDGFGGISCWKLKSIKARIYFLITGKIWVQVIGDHPKSIGLGIGTMFTVKSKDNE